MAPYPTEHLYPAHRRAQLVSVKEGIFHPNLPTFRRMDMDSVAQKLPDEHCRTTTCCNKGEKHKNKLRLTKFQGLIIILL